MRIITAILAIFLAASTVYAEEEGDWTVKDRQGTCSIVFEENSLAYRFVITNDTIIATHVNWDSDPEAEDEGPTNHTYYMVIDKVDYLNKKLISGQWRAGDDNPYAPTITMPNEFWSHFEKAKSIDLFIEGFDTSISIPVSNPNGLIESFNACNRAK
jgi:hypothetical protein